MNGRMTSSCGLTRYAPFLVAAALLSGGCGQSTSLSGTVTFNGQPVQDGAITLLPADGVGPAAGGTITQGAYRIDELTPGKKIVQIIGVKQVEFAQSSEEMARFAESTDFKTNRSDVIEAADIIPDDAIGNYEQIELTTGHQTRDFHLKSPEGRARSAAR